MSKTQEALSVYDTLKMALEFLEEGNFVYPTSLATTIKEALALTGSACIEQPAQDQDQSCPNCDALSKQVTALKTCLEVERGFREQEQPAQPLTLQSDPAATLHPELYRQMWNTRHPDMPMAEQPAQEQKPAGYFRLREYGSALIHDQVSEDAKHNEGVFPLYTPPQPNKPWVGLTQEDWVELKCKTHDEVRVGLDVAAKLREKNA